MDPSNPYAYFIRGVMKVSINQVDSGCLDLSKSGELGFAPAYEEIKNSCK